MRRELSKDSSNTASIESIRTPDDLADAAEIVGVVVAGFIVWRPH
ncbi:hypothetical protein [Congregibacter sp.]